MIALVTRPVEDAKTTAQALEARGYRVMIEPMMRVEPVADAGLDLTGAQAVLATSANGVRALAANTADRDIAVWAVGDATARTARDLGFTSVASAGGDARALADLAKKLGRVDAGRLIHVAGTEVAGDLSALLTADGFHVERAVLYRAHAIDTLSPDVCAALKAGAITVALFFSPRTAVLFARLTAQAGLAAAAGSVTALALSGAVATALAPLPFARVVTSAEPTQEALFSALDQTPIPAD